MPQLKTLTRLAFAATVFLIPFRFRFTVWARPPSPIYRDYMDMLLFAADAAMLTTLGLWLVQLLLQPTRLKSGPYFVTIPLAGLTMVGFATSLFSIDPALSLYHSLRLVLLAAFYLYVLNEIRSLSWIVIPLTFQILIHASIAIAQFGQQHSIGLESFGEYELDPNWSGVSVVATDGMRYLRAYGLSDHPNILGGCLTMGLLLLIPQYFQTDHRARHLYAAAFAIGSVGLFFTFSRAAFAALVIACVLYALALWRARQRQALGRLGILLGLATLCLLPSVIQFSHVLGVRLNRSPNSLNPFSGDQSMDERNALNRAANEIFARNPIVGIGLGTMPQAIYRDHPSSGFFPQPAHLAFLDAAVETGIFGALFYVLLLIAPWLALFTQRKRLHWSPTLLGVSTALLAITFIGFFDYYTWLLVPGRLWQWLIWGLWSYYFQYELGEGYV